MPRSASRAAVTEDHRVPVDVALDALAGQRTKSADRRELGESASLRALDDGRRQRMLARTLETGREPQHGRIGRHADQAGLSLRQRTGLVGDQRVDLLEHLQRLGVANENAGRGATPGPDHDRHGRREPERARARDDQHADRRDERVGQPRLGTDEHPHDEGQRGDGHHGGHEPSGHDVGQALDRSAAALRVAHHADDLGEQRVATHALGAHDEASRPVHRATRDARTGRLLHRDGLAGDHRLVDAAAALEHDSVDGNLLARSHAQPIVHLDILDPDVALATVVTQPSRRLRRQPEERAQRAAGPAARAQLEHLADQDQRGDDRGGLEVERDAVRTGGRDDPRSQRRDDAVCVRDPGADGDQGEHVEMTRADGRPAAHEEGPSAPEHHGRRERELDPRDRALAEGVPHGIAGNQIGHRQQEERHGEDRRDPEPARHVVELGVRLLLIERLLPRLERHATDRTGAGAHPPHLRVHRAGVLDAYRRRCRLLGGRRPGEGSRRLRAETLQTPRAAEVIGATLVNQVMRGSVWVDGHPADRVLRRLAHASVCVMGRPRRPVNRWHVCCSAAGHADDDGAGDRWRVVGLADVGADRCAAQRNAARNGPAQGGAPGRGRPAPSRAAASARRSRVASRRPGLAAEGADRQGHDRRRRDHQREATKEPFRAAMTPSAPPS